MAPSRPTTPRYLKLGFWALLGMLSTATAEVVAGSDPFPFFRPWGIIVTTPLYTLHILVLATVLIRIRSLTWQGLCFAGALFGLYEAYITKVLWDPPWAPDMPFHIAGVAWLHTILLVLWWHPLMAFALPLLVAETFLTRSSSVFQVLPACVHRLLSGRRRPAICVAALAVACSATAAGNATSPEAVFLSAFTNAALLVTLIGLWRVHGAGTRYTLEELLPGPRGLAVLSIALLAIYIVLGVLLRPESFPGVQGHLAIIAVYLFFIGLLLRNRRLYRPSPADPGAPVERFRLLPLFVLVFAFSAFATRMVFGTTTGLFLLLNWLIGGAAGLGVYAYAVYTVCRAQSNPGRVRSP